MKTIFNNKINHLLFQRGKSNQKDKKEFFNKYYKYRDNIFLDEKFDIKQYLDNAKSKYVFNSLDKNQKNSNNNSTELLSNLNNSKFDNNNNSKKIINGSKPFRLNLSVSNNKKPKLDLPSISMNTSKNSYSNIYIPKTKYLGVKTTYNSNNYKNTIFNQEINTRYDKYNTSHDNEENNFFNIIKTVKLIKSKEKNFDFKSYLKKTKNCVDKKNALIALNSDKVLRDYQKFLKANESEDISISTFITERKEVSLNNLLIKLMNLETDKLQKKEKKISKELKKETKTIENEEHKLDEYTNNQKIECKKIETTLVDLITKHENLIKEEQELMLDVKVKEFEIYKLLINMNLYRYFAKFTNTVLDGDPSRFDKQLLPDYHEFDKIDLEPIIEEVINNYSDLKVEDKIKKVDRKKSNLMGLNNNDNKDKKYMIKYKEEGYFLYNPEFLYHKYNEIEGNILRLLTAKERFIIKKLKREKQNNEAFAYLRDRCKDLQNEYNSLKSLYNIEKKKYENDLIEKGVSDTDENIIETNNMLKDLFMCAIEVLENTVLALSKLNKTHFEIKLYNDNNFEDLVKHGMTIIQNLESNLNILFKEIRDERKEDRNTFEKVIKGIKIFYKIERQKVFEKNLIEENKIQRMKMFEKQNNIRLTSRKDEPPYYKNKPKKIVIDYEAIRKEENKDLINFL